MDIESIYKDWLLGSSIDKLAVKYQVPRSSLYVALQRTYGKDACNTKLNGLARVVAQEYGDMALAASVRGVEGTYYTTKNEKCNTIYQYLSGSKGYLLLDNVATPEYQEPDGLRLPYILLLMDVVIHILNVFNI